MARLPEFQRKGFARPISSVDDDDDEKITDNHLEKFIYDGEEYDLIYKSMDPNKDKLVIVKPDVAKEAIKSFIENEIGGFIDGEFKLINKMIDNKFSHIKTELENHIKEKSDILAEEIATEIISSNFKDAVNKKVEAKLEKLKNFLNEE